MRTKRIQGPLVAALLLAVACSSSDDAADEISTEVETTVAATEASQATDAADDDADDEPAGVEAASEPESADSAVPGVPVDFAPDAPLLVEWFAPFEPGTHRTLALGVPMSLTSTEPMFTQFNGQGMFVVTDPASVGPDDRDLVFLRISDLSDPTAPQVPFEETEVWPADDIEGWLANAVDGIEATTPEPTTVGGLPALVFDLELTSEVDCGSTPGICVEFAQNHGPLQAKGLQKGSTYRVWHVDLGDPDPLLVIRGIDGPDEEAWFETSNAVLASVAFGEPTTNPVRELPAGRVDLELLGGLSLDLPDTRVIVQPRAGHGFVRFPTVQGGVEFTETPLTFDGEPLETAEALLAELDAAGFEITPLPDADIGGLAATVVDLEGPANEILLRRDELDVGTGGNGWWSPANGRMWLIEHPDRGLLIFGAFAYAPVGDPLAEVLPWTEAILPTIEFTG